jgi:hypothetical protein
MFEKEIILEEQLAVRCLLQCSPARKLPANAGTLDVQAFKGKSERGQGQPLVYISHPDAVARVIETAARAVK